MTGHGVAACALLVALASCAPRLAGPIPLRLVHQEAVSADGLEEVHELLFLSGRGDSVEAVLRWPAASRRKDGALPAIVLLAGRETGRQAAAVVPGPIEAVVLALEYPEMIPEAAEIGELVRDLPAVRRSAYRVPGLLRGAGRYLASRPEVDPSRIALVGVSFGVPFAAAAAPDSVFCCVALHHGGADLALLFRTNLPIGNPLLRGLASAFAAQYFRLLEPGRYAGEIAPRPLLLINGLYDEMVPRRSALRLAGLARSPVRQIWLPHDHLMPEDVEVMGELADSTLSHFPQLRRARSNSSASAGYPHAGVGCIVESRRQPSRRESTCPRGATMTGYRTIAIPTAVADAVRTTLESPGYGHPASVGAAGGSGPCRHCLRPFRPGETERILFTYDPFRGMESLPLPGPIYVHATRCERYAEDGGFPEGLRTRPLTFNGYARGRRLLAQEYVGDGEVERMIEGLLARPEVDYIHVRSTTAGCYDLRIERADSAVHPDSERTTREAGERR